MLLMKNFLYDKADYQLLNELDAIISGEHPGKHLRRLFEPCLHPRGIKELPAPKELRIVYAMLKLLESLEHSDKAVERRISALHTLRDELMNGVPGVLRINTARVLLQIVKRLVRASVENSGNQLQLAHELRLSLLGQPRFIRRQLRRYHLLEMPEDWNQVTFDDHVHDANTKGRKTPTHLIMDAWIKGIRRLQVIYYNYVPRHAADELLRAAEIMKINVRIGVELPTLFRGKFVEMIWTPRGFAGRNGFLSFLDKKATRTFSSSCATSSKWKTQLVIEQLHEFNNLGRKELNSLCGVKCLPLKEADFINSVGFGQPSLLHLSEFISTVYENLLLTTEKAAGNLPEVEPEQNDLLQLIAPANINERWLNSDAINHPPSKPDNLPKMMRLSPDRLIKRLDALTVGYRLTLNLSGLSLEDVIEIVYDCNDRISHLEIFNLKDHMLKQDSDITAVNEFRLALNQGNVTRLKRIIQQTIAKLEHSDEATENTARVEKMCQILRDLPNLIKNCQRRRIETRIGSDSTGRYRQLYGMGLAVIDTLPRAVRRRLLRNAELRREIIPVAATVTRSRLFIPLFVPLRGINFWARLCRRIGAPFGLGYTEKDEWRLDENAIAIGKNSGNIATLGGYREEPEPLTETLFPVKSFTDYLTCMNSQIKIFLKIMTGLIIAFISFMLSKDWWLLAWGGAFIWLGITGVRNIIQSVVGGGGLRRSDLLKWNDFISWQRVADSLLYTGISVPLLDYGVKTLLMKNTFDVTANNNPFLLYTTMALVNGCYISSHNAFRALPRTAIAGNFFRTVLSIPVAILFNSILFGVLGACNVPGIAGILQQWAAIISKIASDCVAGIIEGYADRLKNIKLRLCDYRVKFDQLFSAYSRLEMIFPEKAALDILKSPKNLMKAIADEEHQLKQILIVNALDLLYFRMHQPQARNALRMIVRNFSPEERVVMVQSQNVLERKKEISQMFIDGLLGKNFTRALAFYLDYYNKYLHEINKMI
jgi:hypothetical protein